MADSKPTSVTTRRATMTATHRRPTSVYGLEREGDRLWYADGSSLTAIDPDSSAEVRRLELRANAGTTFDGRHLYQVADDEIHKIDPETGRIVATLPAPDGSASGLVWAEGSLWVGRYRDKRIHRLDPETGAILATIETRRYVTGVTFLDGQLWHGADDDDGFELHRLDPESGELLERAPLDAPILTGMTPDGDGGLFCGGGEDGTIRRVVLEEE